MGNQVMNTILIGVVFICSMLSGCLESTDSCEHACDTIIEEKQHLQHEYENLSADYDSLEETYLTFVEGYGIYDIPSTLLLKDTIYWRYQRDDGSILTWLIDIDLYRIFTDLSEQTDILSIINDVTSETYEILDIRPYIQSYFFDSVIRDITIGNTDREFVNDAIAIKNQITVLGDELGDHYHWSAETLTHGRGYSGDIGILLASLLQSGNNHTKYSLELSVLYCDSGNHTSPQEINHVMIHVQYPDGSSELIDSTTPTIYEEEEVQGWLYPLESTS